MNTLKDDCLLMILEYFNLNDRTVLRLVCKRYRFLCDSINVKNKLILFERTRPVKGELKFTNEQFNLDDCVNVFDLNKFFNNKSIIQRIRNIRTLIIYGDQDTLIDLDFTFNRLEYLELRNVQFTNPKIVAEGSQFKYVVFHSAFLKSVGSAATKIEPILFYLIGLNLLKTDDLMNKKIKYLSFNEFAPDCYFYKDLIEFQLLQSIEMLNLPLFSDLDELIYLSDNCPKLKRIDIFLRNRYEISELINKSILKEMVCKLRSDLHVFLLGLLLNEQTVSNFMKLFEELTNLIEIAVPSSRITIYFGLSSGNYELLKRLDKEYDLNEFYKLIDEVSFLTDAVDDRDKDHLLFKKFVNCSSVQYGLCSYSVKNISNFLNHFSKVKQICLSANYNVLFTNESFDLLVQRKEQLTKFICRNPNNPIDFKFDFLFKLYRLEDLELSLYNPINQNVLLQLIKNLKYLKKIEVHFVRPTKLYKEDLSSFKKLVNDTFAHKFSAKKLKFRIEIYKRSQGEIVRYVLENENKHSEFDSIIQDKAFKLIQIKKMGHL